jgi:hypothetical protein
LLDVHAGEHNARATGAPAIATVGLWAGVVGPLKTAARDRRLDVLTSAARGFLDWKPASAGPRKSTFMRSLAPPARTKGIGQENMGIGGTTGPGRREIDVPTVLDRFAGPRTPARTGIRREVVMICRAEYEPTCRRSPVSIVVMVIFTSAPALGGSGFSRRHEIPNTSRPMKLM